MAEPISLHTLSPGRAGAGSRTKDWESTLDSDIGIVPSGQVAAIAGRRSALRTLGIASIGVLASLRLAGEAEAKKQTREQRRRERQQRRVQAEKKKGGKVGPTGPAGPPGPTGRTAPQWRASARAVCPSPLKSQQPPN